MQKCLSKSFKVFYKIKTKNKRVAEEKMTEILLIAKITATINITNIMVSVKICFNLLRQLNVLVV